MKIGNRPLVALAMVLAIRGCAVPYQSNARLLDYQLTSEETIIDPNSGDKVIISNWKYEDGVTATTRKVIPRGTEQRRFDRPPPPAPRAID